MARSLAALLIAISATQVARPALASVTPVPHEIAVSYFDVSPPLRDILASYGASDVGSPIPDATPQTGFGTHAMPAPILNFNAFQGLGATPPSPAADAGRDHYVLMSNLRTAIYDKTGAVVGGPFNNNVIWAGFGGTCETINGGSPIVVYDQLADRWLLAQLGAQSAPFSICLAVSTTSDPLGSYYRWSIDFGNEYPDFATFALWRDMYLLGTRNFTNLSFFSGSGAYALNRDDVLAGDPTPGLVGVSVPPGATPYLPGDGLAPTDLDGSQLPPAGSAAYFVGTMDQGGPYGASQDALTLWEFRPDFAVPANTTMTLKATLPVSTFDSIFPCVPTRRCIPQPGVSTTQYLDVLASRQRWIARVAYRNFGTHESIVMNQSTDAEAGMAGLRWYELRDPGGTPVVHQQGIYAPGLTDQVHRWCGSIAMDAVGNVALGYSASSTTVFPSMFYTGRLAGDPLGTLPQGEGVFVNGTGAQTSTSNRWGNTSVMSVDPADDCTFWHVNEYYPVTSTTAFMLRVGTFKFPNCSTVGVDEPQAPLATRLLPIGLSAGSVPIRFWLDGAAVRDVRLDVHDVSGRLVKRLVDETLGGGAYARAWDRTSDAGTRVRPGVYYVRLRAGGVTDSAPAVLVE